VEHVAMTDLSSALTGITHAGSRRLATAPPAAMTKKKTRSPRRYTADHFRRLDRTIAHYIAGCSRRQVAARVSELAALLKRNPQYLTRTTREMTGRSLGKHLRRRQLDEAERLLLTTPLTIAQIARRAAFGTVATFYRHFSEAYGMPPARFREVRK
jgi:AraC family transcriptional regulator